MTKEQRRALKVLRSAQAVCNQADTHRTDVIAQCKELDLTVTQIHKAMEEAK